MPSFGGLFAAVGCCFMFCKPVRHSEGKTTYRVAAAAGMHGMLAGVFMLTSSHGAAPQCAVFEIGPALLIHLLMWRAVPQPCNDAII